MSIYLKNLDKTLYDQIFSRFGRAYHYITLCPSFHSIDQLDKVMDWIEETVQRGDPHYAQDPYWLTNRGQFFLHEMMHLDSIGQPKGRKARNRLRFCLR